MAKTTGERLERLEEKVDGVVGDVKEIKDIVTALDKKFASKWVERVVSGMVGLILAAFIGLLITAAFSPPPATTTSIITRTTTTVVHDNGTTTKTVQLGSGAKSVTTEPSVAGATPSTTTQTETTPVAEQNSGVVQGLISTIKNLI